MRLYRFVHHERVLREEGYGCAIPNGAIVELVKWTQQGVLVRHRGELVRTTRWNLRKKGQGGLGLWRGSKLTAGQ